MLDYPQVKTMNKLNDHLDDWLDLLYKYGEEIGCTSGADALPAHVA